MVDSTVPFSIQMELIEHKERRLAQIRMATTPPPVSSSLSVSSETGPPHHGAGQVRAASRPVMQIDHHQGHAGRHQPVIE
jgi:hypothetical protein